MFRAQGNIFDEVVVKATDENLTSENWEYILVRCILLASTAGATLLRCSALLDAA